MTAVRADRAFDQVFSQFVGFIDQELVGWAAGLGVVTRPVPLVGDPFGNLIRNWVYQLVVHIGLTAGGFYVANGDSAGLRIGVDSIAESLATPDVQLPRQRRPSSAHSADPTSGFDDRHGPYVAEAE